MSEVKTEYKGVEIVYHENDAKWRYELHGRERSSDRLDAAKKTIDTQPKEKHDFTPQSAIFLGYGESEIVNVTAIAEGGYDTNQTYYWIKDSKGKRSKEYRARLFIDGPANHQLLRESKALDNEARILNKKAEAKRKEMAPFNPKA